MTKLTKSQISKQLEMLVIENEQLRRLNAEWALDARKKAFTIVKLNATIVALRTGALRDAA